ncbi:hypothetical protein [Halorubellus sp. PRR65]|uniref:hypothetical protein n=1 Tax=Halorubellus sp. PRR65 TaxID=3098148 RepID=UPI002B25B7C5|nr:hypothetical protein [Halorubellus sp. PRR65]
MAQDCARCGADIDDADVRYTEHATDGTDTYCSVNCIADVERVDEQTARSNLFADLLEA